MFLISDLCTLLETYLEEENVQEVYRAYEFGATAHEGQKRLSGEPYIYHPLAVARILASLKLDHKTIMAAILHDVIEDTETAKEQLAREFGEEVAELVDGVSKLTMIKFESKAEAQAENFQKLILAMAKDVRVILIKLADRVHNMRTIGIMRAEKQRRIAKETLDIYVPIAHRLGINNMRLELQELGFQALHPKRYTILQDAILKVRGNRKEIINKIENAICIRLGEENLPCQIIGREKHLYSIYSKMRTKNLSFSEVFDVYAFRIVVDKVDTCYRVLGMLHNLYKPLPGRFKDYIAIPKNNGYQSLHTVLFGPYGVPIEIQIRTDEMDKVAEAGIAAHWLYKQNDTTPGSSKSAANEWLSSLLELQKTSGNSIEFLENVKIDLFPDSVYVFTPTGEIMELPRGATAVDFAYAVHSDIGNACVAIKIDRHLSPLRAQLETGQTVEIITAPGAKPNPAWLNFVVTSKARTNIRHYLKNLQKSEAISLGRRLLDRNLNTFSLSIDRIPQDQINTVLKKLKLHSIEELLSDIGLGNRMPLLVAKQIKEQIPEIEKKLPRKSIAAKQAAIKNIISKYTPAWFKAGTARPKPLAIKGTEGIVVNYAKCCHPIPGDPIAGIFSAGKGIVIHGKNCSNVREYKKQPENILELKWESNIDSDFPVEIRVQVANNKGVLATVASVISDQEANIENINIDDSDTKHTELVLTISVSNRLHLANVMRQIKLLDQVKKISRSKG
ncbi:MAG TPA: bifunctional GTP diphosphokinase/guanosine-3',5'-bis pyrophosphate 3'-pyrophosphohydrolase [Gammaproteobacteria bacterium]|nr:bifunctional GTP diphosphokinase/guanosine-3',5'-bis pyrophosphate 3'-pyrophosphohydrolase [Gammaproteobacteria bacterium]